MGSTRLALPALGFALLGVFASARTNEHCESFNTVIVTSSQRVFCRMALVANHVRDTASLGLEIISQTTAGAQNFPIVHSRRQYP